MLRHLTAALLLVGTSSQAIEWNGCRLSGGTNAIFTSGSTLRVDIPAPTEVPWNVQILNPTNALPLEKGEWLLLKVDVRSRADTAGIVKAYLFGYAPDWETIGSTTAEVGHDWKTIYASGKAPGQYRKDKYGFTLHLGSKKQSLEFREIKLTRVGRDVDPSTLPFTAVEYPGRSPDAAWRKTAAERIERHRKADLEVKVVGAGGKPIANAEVQVAMTRHAYGFGTFLEYQAITGKGADNDLLRQRTLEMFNRCTTPIYYADWGWANPGNRKRYLECAAWAQEHNLPTRGHCIIYPGYRFMPKAALALTNNPPALRQHLLEQIKETTLATKQFQFTEYDVCNELRHLTELPGLLGKEAVVEWYAEARKHAPQSRMAVNENTILTSAGNTEKEQENYLGWIRYLSEHGQRPDVIGMQGHFGEALTHPARVVEILDRFGKLGIPIHVTEFDINTRDEVAQGAYTRDFLTAVFSHPATEAITVWGFWEGRMWRPNGAMLRKDWSLKPNGKAWMDLVYSEWWTDETLRTDRAGKCRIRGFLGDYTATVNGHTKTFPLKEGGGRITVVVE